MSIVKSLAVGHGDMYYVRHNSDNFTIIDCCLPDASSAVIKEVKEQSAGKGVVRFISTHPDDDHIRGLVDLDNAMGFVNFYCVKNNTTKTDVTTDFRRYCALRDHPTKAFHLESGCSRNWMNKTTEERGSAGINIVWPIVGNAAYQAALKVAEDGGSPNDISCVVKYSLADGATLLWMGDLSTAFMEDVADDVTMPAVDVLFAAHHGRDIVPKKWLDEMNPQIIVIGEGPAKHLNYYAGYNTITQNSAGDIIFDCVSDRVHIYVSKPEYSVDFLEDEAMSDTHGTYIGTLAVKR